MTLGANGSAAGSRPELGPGGATATPCKARGVNGGAARPLSPTRVPRSGFPRATGGGEDARRPSSGWGYSRAAQSVPVTRDDMIFRVAQT